MKRVLITGAGGFLGRHLVKRFLEEDDIEVFALTSQKEALEIVFGNSKLFTVLCKEDDINKNDFDILINCAYPRNVDGIQMAEGLSYIDRVYRAAASGKVKAVINISSQSVYSQIRKSAADEDEPINLETKYAIGKYAVELLTNRMFEKIPHTNIRLGSLIGAGFDQRLVNKFVRQAMEGNALNIKGGNQQFGFLDVRDAADAIAVMIQKNKKWHEIYNLGSERGYSLLEIAECVAEKSQQYSKARTQINLEKTDDWQNSVLNCTRFYEQFEWKPAFPLPKTVDDIFKIISGYQEE